MSEQQPSQECITCPNRGKLSQVLAKLVCRSELAPGCEGPVTVSHGLVETQVRLEDEPDLDEKDFAWSIQVSSMVSGDRHYSKTTWTTDTICGREPVGPHSEEVPYHTEAPTWTAKDGSRYAAFVSGDDRQIAELRGMQGLTKLLDATSEMQRAEGTGDTVGIQAAKDSIASQGFSLEATAGRHDGKKNR